MIELKKFLELPEEEQRKIVRENDYNLYIDMEYLNGIPSTEVGRLLENVVAIFLKVKRMDAESVFQRLDL